MKESLSGIGVGGSFANAFAALQELQGLTFSLLAGALADTKIDLAAICDEDTVVFAMNNDAGVLTDITADISIVDLRATGTVTVAASPVNADTVTVNGKVYTIVPSTTVIAYNDFTKINNNASDDVVAASLAAAINARELVYASGVHAEAAAAVVTITANVAGTGGNAYTLAEAGESFTVSGATLAGGSATGGIKSTSATDQVLVAWFNKR